MAYFYVAVCFLLNKEKTLYILFSLYDPPESSDHAYYDKYYVQRGCVTDSDHSGDGNCNVTDITLCAMEGNCSPVKDYIDFNLTDHTEWQIRKGMASASASRGQTALEVLLPSNGESRTYNIDLTLLGSYCYKPPGCDKSIGKIVVTVYPIDSGYNYTMTTDTDYPLKKPFCTKLDINEFNQPLPTFGSEYQIIYYLGRDNGCIV